MRIRDLIIGDVVDYDAIYKHMAKVINIIDCDAGPDGEFWRFLSDINSFISKSTLASLPIVSKLNEHALNGDIDTVNECILLRNFAQLVSKNNAKVIVDRMLSKDNKPVDLCLFLINNNYFNFNDDAQCEDALNKLLDCSRYIYINAINILLSQCNSSIVFKHCKQLIADERLQKNIKKTIMSRLRVGSSNADRSMLFHLFNELVKQNNRKAILCALTNIPDKFKDDYVSYILNTKGNSRKLFTGKECEALLGLDSLNEEQLTKVLKRASNNRELELGDDFKYVINENILKKLSPVQRVNFLFSIVYNNPKKPRWIDKGLNKESINKLMFASAMDNNSKVKYICNNWWR